jgi:hypothetical protein
MVWGKNLNTKPIFTYLIDIHETVLAKLKPSFFNTGRNYPPIKVSGSKPHLHVKSNLYHESAAQLLYLAENAMPGQRYSAPTSFSNAPAEILSSSKTLQEEPQDYFRPLRCQETEKSAGNPLE